MVYPILIGIYPINLGFGLFFLIKGLSCPSVENDKRVEREGPVLGSFKKRKLSCSIIT